MQHHRPAERPVRPDHRTLHHFVVKGDGAPFGLSIYANTPRHGLNRVRGYEAANGKEPMVGLADECKAYPVNHFPGLATIASSARISKEAADFMASVIASNKKHHSRHAA